MTEQRYVLQMHFNTQGNYGWDIVPSGFNYDHGVYTYKTIFNNLEEISKWREKTLPVLINSFYCVDNSKYKTIPNILADLGSCMLEPVNFYHHESYEYLQDTVFIQFKPAKYEDNGIPVLTDYQRDIIYFERLEYYYAMDLVNKATDQNMELSDDEIREGVEMFFSFHDMDNTENECWDLVLKRLASKVK